MQYPTDQHFDALIHTLSYVGHTACQGILLKASNKLNLQAFFDSDWASCIDTRHPITGYVLMLGQSPVSWKSKKQSTISKSSSEAEYRALSSAASEITWIVRLLDLDLTHLQPVTLFCDNQSAIHVAHNPIQHERTKHIATDCHFTCEKVLEGLLHLAYIPTNEQLADLFTKSLPSTQLLPLLYKLGVYPTPSLRGMLIIYKVRGTIGYAAAMHLIHALLKFLIIPQTLVPRHARLTTFCYNSSYRFFFFLYK